MQSSSSVMFHSQTTAFGTFGGDSTVLNDGYVICNSMRNGATPAQEVNALLRAGIGLNWSDANRVVELAGQDLCFG